MSPKRKISDSTIRRLSRYLHILRDLEREGTSLVSSEQLAEGSATTAAQVRKDLSHFGSFGKRGRGYAVDDLSRSLEKILGLGRVWNVTLIGVGKIGSALLGYDDLERRGFRIVAAFDADPRKVGRVFSGLTVRPMQELEAIVTATGAELAILATPPESATGLTLRLADAGIGAILSFAPVKGDLSAKVPVRTVDVALELEGLTFLLSGAGKNGEAR